MRNRGQREGCLSAPADPVYFWVFIFAARLYRIDPNLFGAYSEGYPSVKPDLSWSFSILHCVVTRSSIGGLSGPVQTQP